MRAMTWWDHQTSSIWSQPTGTAIGGALVGTQLDLLPSQVTTWANWVAAYPQTFVLVNDFGRLGTHRQTFSEEFVIGVQIDGWALAFYYQAVAQSGFVQTVIGDWPVLVWAADAEYGVFLRQGGEQTLTFFMQDGEVYDDQTGSRWDIVHGLALEGPLKGQVLQPLPSLTAYDWAWLDFYPGSGIYGE